MQIRLQKILSTAGLASRRTAETLITEGRVTVNGKPVSQLGAKADPETDDIRVDARRVKPPARRRYILLYKPRGYITTRSDPERRPTVIDLLTTGGVREYVYPVGRLDYDSEGLLLLTSDGELAAQLTHPRHGVGREYHVRVRGVLDDRAMERLRKGIALDGERTAPATVDLHKVIEGTRGQDSILSMVIYEGRNRQIRRMCEAIGHPVSRLKRVRIGPIQDEHIRPGEFRDLSEKEIALLKREGTRPAPAVKSAADRRAEVARAPRPSAGATDRAGHKPPAAGANPRAPRTSHSAPRTEHAPRRTPDLKVGPTARREGTPRSGPPARRPGSRRTDRPRRG